MRVAVTLAALLVWTGCAGPPRHPPPADPSETVAPDGLNGTDVAWLQLMVPMNEQLLPLLDLVARQGAVPGVTDFAARLRASHQAELLALRQRRDRAGLPPTNVHVGHVMPGLVTEADLAVLRRTSGDAFDRHFVAIVRAHLAQGVTLARGERQSGADPATKSLAVTIERTRTTQLAALDGFR